MILILSAALEALLYCVTFLNICKIKFGKVESLVFLGLVATAIFFIYYAFPRGASGVFINVAVICILTVAANRKNKILLLAILHAALSVILAIFSGYTMGVGMVFIFPHMSRAFMLANWFPLALYFVMTFVVSYILSKKLGNFLQNRIAPLNNALRKQFAYYMLGGTSITLVIFLAIVFLPYLHIDTAVRNLAYASLLVIHLIFLIFAVSTFTDSFRKEEELKRNREMLTSLHAYTENVENMATEVRKFRHDHRNLLLGFREYIAHKDIDGVNTYYEKYLSSFVEGTVAADSQLDVLMQIKIPEIKSILSSKLLYAQHLNIKVDIEVASEIPGVVDNILVDLCRIVGILLDNAIEACKVVEIPVLKFMAMEKDSNILLVFTNSLPSATISVAQIFKEGFTTKEDGRGLGLPIAAQLCNKNKDIFLNTIIQDSEFTQELFIML